MLLDFSENDFTQILTSLTNKTEPKIARKAHQRDKNVESRANNLKITKWPAKPT